MTIKVTATDAKARILSLLDDVETGEEIEITRHGRTIARIVPAAGPRALEGLMTGIASTADPDDDLLSAGLDWELE